jgi:polyhydroxybutyrate depolymerase
MAPPPRTILRPGFAVATLSALLAACTLSLETPALDGTEDAAASQGEDASRRDAAATGSDAGTADRSMTRRAGVNLAFGDADVNGGGGDAADDASAPPDPGAPPPDPDPPPPDPDPPPPPPPPDPPPPAFGCGARTTSAGFLGRQTLTVGGAARTYELYLPADYDSTKAYPIVFAFHGDNGTGAGIRSSFALEAASGGQALIAYPDGTSKTWHIDTLSAMMPDVAFIDAIVDSLSATYCVDGARIFATGMSRGAYFVNQLACRSRTSFRAIASHAGGGPFGVADSEWDGHGNLSCSATLSALQVHGLSDTTVPVTEGYKARDFWRARNSCTASTSAYGTSPCVAYAGCARPEVWCAIPGLGHKLWSSAATVTWSFFASMP